MKPTDYYHVPVWMSSIIYIFVRAGLVQKLKNRERASDGMYIFADSEEKSREETLVVWDKTTSAKTTLKCLIPLLPDKVSMLVSMAEKYAKKRNGREETKVHQGIIQLLIARTVELYSKKYPDETLTINGDFGLIGQLPPDGRLCINGKVGRIDGSTGGSLEVKCEECPQMQFRGMAIEKNGVWQIKRTIPNCVMPPE